MTIAFTTLLQVQSRQNSLFLKGELFMTLPQMPEETVPYATPEGTQRFRKRFEGSPSVAQGHFRLTSDGLSLSSLGMGTYLGAPDESTTYQMANAAIESVASGAVNILDTAINYRHQLSERAIGHALRELATKHDIYRDELFICTKAGFLAPDAEAQPSGEAFRVWFRKRYLDSGLLEPEDIVGGMHCMAGPYLRDQINISRENLGVETIDLFYLHNAIESQMPTIGRDAMMNRLIEAFEALEMARADGHIRYYGLATWTCFRSAEENENEFFNLETLVRLAETVGGEAHGLRYIQLPFNFAFTEALILEEQRVQGETMSLLEAAMALGVQVLTSVPLLQGQLLEEQQLPKFDGLNTPAQSCLQFVRSQPGILAPLVGHKAPAHVAENLHVASVPPLPLETMEAQIASLRH
jgi:aryl-alcohol dehydrogenase-like predicted oxidoreductase